LTLKYIAIVTDSLVKLLFPRTDKHIWDYNTNPIQKSPKRYKKTRHYDHNGLHEKQKGITLHDENNFDFPSVQTTQSLASI